VAHDGRFVLGVCNSLLRTEISSFNALGSVRLQKRQIESELKVRQKERVPSRFDTRLWLYGLHGRVQSEAFRFKYGALSSIFKLTPRP
jgi:hypothetical protein